MVIHKHLLIRAEVNDPITEEKKLKKWLKNTNYQDDPLLFMESIPSRETRWFIEKVLTKYWLYQDYLEEESNSLEMLAKGENPIY